MQLILDFPPNENYQLTNFVNCSENSLAYEASKRVAESFYSKDLNPLIIVGGAGSGKTHLLHGIANKVKSTNSDVKILVVSASLLIDRYKSSESYFEVTNISSEYKSLDFLLIDDIHLIEKIEKIQEQIFHIFNEFVFNGKQLVFSSAIPPDQLKGIESYLYSRLLTGALAKIETSGDQIRHTILKKIAMDRFIKLSDNSAIFITNNCTRDIKEFDQLLQKISEYSMRIKRNITPALIRELFTKQPYPQLFCLCLLLSELLQNI